MGREALVALITMTWIAPLACGGNTATGSGGGDGASRSRGGEVSGSGGLNGGSSGVTEVGDGGTNGGSGGATGAGGTGGAVSTGGSGGRAFQYDAGLLDSLSTADVNCRTHPVVDDCIACCDGNHPKAYLVQAEPTRQCACDAPGLCASDCALTYCASPPAAGSSDPCYPCVFGTLGINGQCFGVAVKACGANAECRAYVDCRANCVR